MRPWSPDERAWARECVLAGDTAEDIAEMAGRTVADVRANVAWPHKALTAREREAISLYSAGLSLAAIGQTVTPGASNPADAAKSLIRRAWRKGFELAPARRGRPRGDGQRRGGGQ